MNTDHTIAQGGGFCHSCGDWNQECSAKGKVKSNVKGHSPFVATALVAAVFDLGVPVGSAEETAVQAEKEAKTV
jgi:hypothetical protein